MLGDLPAHLDEVPLTHRVFRAVYRLEDQLGIGCREISSLGERNNVVECKVAGCQRLTGQSTAEVLAAQQFAQIVKRKRFSPKKATLPRLALAPALCNEPSAVEQQIDARVAVLNPWRSLTMPIKLPIIDNRAQRRRVEQTHYFGGAEVVPGVLDCALIREAVNFNFSA